MMSRRLIAVASLASAVFAAGAVQAQSAVAPAAAAATASPEAQIQRMSSDVLDAVKSDKAIQAGDIGRISALVDSKVMPNVNFQRMTASAVGRYWRQATPEQQKRLQDEFKQLLLRTYSGALTQVREQTTMQIKPTRSVPDAAEMVVRTEVRGSGDPVQLDYRLEKTTGAWKIYDVNVLGVWLVENYRNSFAQEIGANGIDGLIGKLADKNRSAAAGSKS